MKPLTTLGLAVTLCAAGTAQAADFPFAEATIDSLQTQMAAGTLTAHQLTAAYLQRIAEIDRSGPKLNAVLEVNPDALSLADGLDAERRAGRVRGPLHGIPVLLKDNLDTADRMETTAGSLALVGQRPPRDAHVVARLREAGAVILGKTNLSEWANFRGRNSCSGWSARGGQTRNPYALDRNPSGSSSGSAAAVSANLCVVAIGTETDGSIVSPASACGIVGIKPTVGLVSRAVIIPLSASKDSGGPTARTVRDAALDLAAIAGPDPRDPATQEIPADLPAALAAPLRANALRGARNGLVRGPFGFPARREPLQEELAETLRAAGAEVIDPVRIATLRFVGAGEVTVFSYEFKDGLNRYLAEPGRETPMKSMTDIIAFNRAHRDQELVYFDQERFEEAEQRGPLTDPAYLEALALCRRLARTEGLDPAFDDQKLDALVMFTRGIAGLTDPYAGEAPTGDSSSLAAVAGYPSITLPAASQHGLPIGVSFVGPAWSEAKLLALAADFEAKAGKRKAPEFLETVTQPGASQ
jgi:amidase